MFTIEYYSPFDHSNPSYDADVATVQVSGITCIEDIFLAHMEIVDKLIEQRASIYALYAIIDFTCNDIDQDDPILDNFDAIDDNIYSISFDEYNRLTNNQEARNKFQAYWSSLIL